ncbi:chemotaxis protein CheX [Caproiciproducens galactitolivorans]|uniref:CheY-P phosphatase CheX n=1 Tax=Caproiciproducens galactitolivorans TaxID=642589 RepID=A0A4Z0YGY5_9FIRM|nr:chemotaxis protein CheX [Caproiciproducens galactitolivorans]QEY35224.1 chemotaxis protein CheX [Caproiciproducens galactitolivorans]TGJ76916.1 CheY-P phosphatase CheX [Caproiciproducens galactitolivorans]
MSNKYEEAFSNTFLNVMPQFGIESVTLERQTECGSKIDAPGVVCIIGVTGDLHGNVIFAMTDECAKMVASSMMGGMPILEFDEMAQSAISELGNMLAAGACTYLEIMGIKADISTPTLMHGDFVVQASFEQVTCLEMRINDMHFYIYVSLERK